MPDILEDVKQSLDSTWQSIRDRMLEEIYKTHPVFLGIEPEIKLMRLGVGGKETLQVSLLKKENNIYLGRTIYTDRFGEILHDLCPR